MDLHHLPEGTHRLAHRPGSLDQLTFQIWSAWGDLHSQGCSILSRTGLLVPINHTPVGDPDLHPEGSAILSRRGLLFPLKPVAAK